MNGEGHSSRCVVALAHYLLLDEGDFVTLEVSVEPLVLGFVRNLRWVVLEVARRPTCHHFNLSDATASRCHISKACLSAQDDMKKLNLDKS
jgi:hypothetical protein